MGRLRCNSSNSDSNRNLPIATCSSNGSDSNGGVITIDTCSSFGSCETTASTIIPKNSSKRNKSIKTKATPKSWNEISKSKKQDKQQQSAMATFEGQELLIVTTIELVWDPVPDSRGIERAEVIMEWHPSHSSKKHVHEQHKSKKNGSRGSRRKSSEDHDAASYSSYESNHWNRNTPTTTNRKSWCADNRNQNVVFAALLLISISTIVFYQPSLFRIPPVKKSLIRIVPVQKSRRKFFHPTNTVEIETDANAETIMEEADDHHTQQQSSRSGSHKDETESGHVDDKVTEIEGGYGDNAKLVIHYDPELQIRYHLDDESKRVLRTLNARARVTQKQVLTLAGSGYKFVLGLEGDDDDESILGHRRKFLLCSNPVFPRTIVKKRTIASEKYTQQSLRNNQKAVRAYQARRKRREADYQRENKLQASKSGGAVPNQSEGTCIAATRKELQPHHFHSGFGDGFVYDEVTDSPYEREPYSPPYYST